MYGWLIWLLIRFLLSQRRNAFDSPLALNLNEPAPRPEPRRLPVDTVCTYCGFPYQLTDYRDDAERIYCSFCHTDLTGEWILGRLRSLSVETSSLIREVSISEAESEMDRFSVRTNWTKTYQTCAIIRPLPPDADSSGQIVWRAEVIRPDRLHVRQIAGTDYDEWITIGEATWERLVWELCGPDACQSGSHRAPVNERMGIDRFPKLLKVKTPQKAECRRYSTWELLRLHWESITPDILACALGGPEDDASTEHDFTGTMDAWLWSDCRLAKIQFIVKDARTAFEFVQTFAMYDSPLEVADPRQENADRRFR